MIHGVYIDGERPRSKRALKLALAEDVCSVAIEDAAHYGLPEPIEASMIPEGEEYEVVGPDPYTDRRWTATITRSNGRVIVR